jgi:hypothetical protein
MRQTLLNFGGDEGGRTPDLRIANAALCQTELHPQRTNLDNKNSFAEVSSQAATCSRKAVAEIKSPERIETIRSHFRSNLFRGFYARKIRRNTICSFFRASIFKL